MKKLLIAAAVAAAATVPAVASAQAGSLVVRARVAQIVPADKSDAIPALGVPADAITVSKKVIPDVDFVYFFTDNLAAELLLTVPQKHDVKVNGTKIGSFKHLPPTLLAQWHFMPSAAFSPYVGAGVNLTFISSVNLSAGPGLDLDLDSTSVGGALQAGFDYKLDRNWSLNFDVKYIQIRSDVTLKANGAKVSEVKVDPIVWGVGVGYRF
ncbi:MAG: outer membrane beta-barrel protein [Burkholderiaceae bacterium]|nr:outer membrane beta-barrel protein [Burkholderiaceae bacterium]